MSKKLLPIIVIYVGIVIGWFVLGLTVFIRTSSMDERLAGQVGQSWGMQQTQEAPSVYYETREEYYDNSDNGNVTESKKSTRIVKNILALSSSDIEVELKLQHLKKGLLWYPTYRVGFASDYVVENTTSEARKVFITFAFPSQEAIYDDFKMTIGDKLVKNISLADGLIKQPVILEPGQRQDFSVIYTSQGMKHWWYDFGEDVSRVSNFTLDMTTNMDSFNIPESAVSPSKRILTDSGWNFSWEYENLLSAAQIGIQLHAKLNPGPWVGRVTLAAPVSLFLFFFLVFIFTTVKNINLHPMHYFFIGVSFFSFHLLLAYLVDHISIHTALIICSIVSIALVVSYMRLIVGNLVAYREIALSQFIYLVVFSYTFFFEGFTGLAISILCIVTLFLVMQFTGRVDWEEIFRVNDAAQDDMNN